MGTKNGRSSKPAATTSALESPLLDVDAVALVLGVTRRHLQRLVAERRIPYLKIGQFVRFDPAVLNVWLDEQRVEPMRSTSRDYAPWR